MLTPFLISSDPSGRRHSPDPFPMSSHRRTNNGHLESNLYIREREENCALSRTYLISNLICSLFRTQAAAGASHYGSSSSARWFPSSLFPYLLTGTVYPNSWTRFSSESLGMLTADEGFYRAGQQDDAASGMLEPVSHATPDHVFARISRSGDITMVPRCIGCVHPPAVQQPPSTTPYVDTVHCVARALIRGAGFPARPGPHATRHTAWRAMCGHVWHHARAAARGRGKGCAECRCGR
jgi:hypothetical protein